MSGTASMRVAAAAIVLAVASRPASAQPGLTPPAPAPQERPQTVTSRYGGAIFAADGIVAAVALGTGRAEPLVGLLLTGPVIHGMYGRGRAAIQSLLVRGLVPFAGLWIGAATCGDDTTDDSYACLDSAAIGFGVGALAAFGFDYFFLARDTITVTPARVQPAVTVTDKTTSVGLRLTF